MRHNTVADIKSKLDKCVPTNGPLETPCLVWPFGKNGSWYGSVCVGGKVWCAHRLAWVVRFGEPESGLRCCHKCDNRACCNTEHMFLGTDADNVKDMLGKGRHVVSTGDRNGSRKYPERLPHGDDHWTRTNPEMIRRGEESHWAKLTEDAVFCILTKYHRGGTSHRKLAAEYGVSHFLVGQIIRGKSWKHVHDRYMLAKLAWEQEASNG